MRATTLLLVLITGLGAGLAAKAGVLAAPPAVERTTWVQTTVADWEAGSFEGLLVSNNDDGELRLDSASSSGVLLSPIHEAAQQFTAVSVTSSGDLPAGTRVQIEVRTSADGQTWSEWRDAGTGRAPEPLSTDGAAQWLQYRLLLESQQPPASPVVEALTFTLLDASDGPTLNDQPPRQPAIGGGATDTPRPLIIPFDAWGPEIAQPSASSGRPQRIVVSRLPGGGDSLEALRQLQAVRGGQLSFAYVVDAAGNIIQARPTVADAGGTISVAFLGEPGSEAALAMAQLLAWLGEAYDLDAQAIVVDESGTAEGEAALREQSSRATVRSRWFFPEGNTRDFTERIMLYNPGAIEANATLIAYLSPGVPTRQSYTIPAGQRLDITLNDEFGEVAELPLEIIADQPILAEQTLLFVNDALNAPGVSQPSRSWYFAEGSSDDAETYLVIYNPQDSEAAVLTTLYNSEGVTSTTSFPIAPHSRYVLAASDLMDGTFGMKVVASQPVAAVRTIRVGQSGGHLSVGAPAPSRTWYFAEGTTESPITTTLAVVNPSPERTNATLTIYTGDGTALARSYALPPFTRITINLRELAPGLGVASAITADRPVVAERTILLDNGRAATSTIGAPELDYAWRFVEGRTSEPATEYLVIANPNNAPARVRIVYRTDGEPVEQTLELPRRARAVLNVAGVLESVNAHTTDVYASLPVVAERTQLIVINGETGGHTSFGIPERR